jgi:phospholipid/cholesterol/gamma-HCH transport system substrate-binding protein
VLTPWRNDTVPDDQFPASGRVYQEQVKWLPGIAAESRGMDANGQFVKSLSNGAQYAYPVNNGKFYITGLPLQGVNPPRADPPPLRGDVPCETQEPPILESRPQDPPEPRVVDYGTPTVALATERAEEEAIEAVREEFDAVDLDIPVLDRVLKRSDIPKIDKAAP